ncbi:MAG: hypothetical protein IKU66_02680 [Clostridia bacterium]|nr:hypothetical protein [Clostridia bacterium]
MVFYNFLIPLFCGFVICIFIVNIKYIDFVGFLLKIMPFQNINGYDNQRKFQNSILYHHHKKKWKLVYLLFILSYVFFYVIFSVVIKNVIISFLLALFLSSIVFGVIENMESKERKFLMKEWEKEQSRTQVDGSLSSDESNN